jgi:hypothetical protein
MNTLTSLFSMIYEWYKLTQIDPIFVTQTV